MKTSGPLARTNRAIITATDAHQGHAATAHRQPQTQPDRNDADRRCACEEAEARSAEEDVHRIHREPQARSGMRTLDTCVACDASRSTDERRVTPDASDVELGLGHVACRIPVVA